MSRAVILAVVGDLHVGSTVALCPKKVDLDDAGLYRASRAQRWILQCWRKAWEAVWSRAEEHNTEVYAVLNGDLVEGVHHGREQLVTDNLTIQLRMAREVLLPVAQGAARLFVVRGTQAHSGGAGRLEEKLAEDLRATKDDAAGTHSWWHLPLEVGGVQFDICHHPATSGYRPWTRHAAASRQAAIVAADYTEDGLVVSDVAIRSHVHYFADSGLGYRPRTFFTRPWKLTDAFSRRLGAGSKIEPPGLLMFVCRDGTYRVEDIHFAPRRRKAWRASKAK